MVEDHFSHHFAHENKGDLSKFYSFDKGKGKLGEGSFGSVFKAQEKPSKEGDPPGPWRAIKAIDKKGLDKPKDLEKFKNEMKIMKELDHPHIIRLYETFTDHVYVYLVMEMCDGGELFDRILDSGGEGFDESLAATYMRQILGAMYYCHSRKIAHRDIKPENFLMQDKTPDAAIKVIDFGLACHCQDGKLLATKAGTPYYVAPEVLKGSYDHKCDIWSCGVIAYILLCGYPPFYGDEDSQILAMVRAGKFEFPDEDWHQRTPASKELITEMLEFNYNNRPEAQKLLERPWIQQARKEGEAFDKTAGLKMAENLKKFRQVRTLKKTAITVIATQLADKDLKSLKTAFAAVDKNEDGVISVAEMTAVLKQLNIPDAEAKQTLEKLDSDGSGEIDYTEFIAAVMDKSTWSKREHLWMAFRAFDENHDGKISKEELKKFLAGDNGSQISDAKLMEMINEVDNNGDGCIDFDEFVQFMNKE